MIDLHGAPGSQNGWEETGLVGPIGFVDNSSNSDRSLNVLRNLTAEFTQAMYGGAVTSEPQSAPSYSPLTDPLAQTSNFSTSPSSQMQR